MLTFHIIVAYVITAQPLHRFFHSTLFPRTLDEYTFEARLHWALISVGYLSVCFILGNSIPFFADMQAAAVTSVHLLLHPVHSLLRRQAGGRRYILYSSYNLGNFCYRHTLPRASVIVTCRYRRSSARSPVR